MQEPGTLNEAEVLNEQLHFWSGKASSAVDELEESLLTGSVEESELVDVIYAADNVKAAALEVADVADVDLSE